MVASTALLALGLAIVVDCAILYRDSRDVIQDDLEVTGNIYNDDLWTQIDALQSPSGLCSIGACSGHGNCTQTNTSRICVCNEGFCGPTCAIVNTVAVSFVSARRPTATTGEIVFAPHHCTPALTTSDSVRLVKGTCANPTNIMRTLTSPTINSFGYATFTGFDVTTPTVLFQPMVVCYKLNSSTVYNTVPNAPAALPCTTVTDYTCPATGTCLSACTSCTGYTIAYIFTQRLCLKNAALAPAVVQNTPMFTCGACSTGNITLMFDGNTANYGYCATITGGGGDCAVWLDLTVDWVIYMHNAYLKIGNESNSWNHHVMYFNSTNPPLPTDSYAQLAAKSLLNFADYDQFSLAIGTSHDYSYAPPRARYALVYSKGRTWQSPMGFADIRFVGYPYN